MRDILSALIGQLPEKPKHLSSANWDAIVQEHDRLVRANLADDMGDIIGQCKSLVESVSRVALEIDGHPALMNDSYAQVVKNAHNLLKDTRTEGQSIDSAGRNACNQISKIVQELGKYRNSSGSGHGRAFQPEIRDDTAYLIASSAILWVRWALPRLNDFAYERPESLIRDLIVENAIFYRGKLIERLENIDLPGLDPQHQRQIGVAVARRAMKHTFVVKEDGVESCSASNSLDFWTEQYRLGVVTGLFTANDGDISISKWAVQKALLILDPIVEIADDLGDINDVLEGSGLKAKLALTSEEKNELVEAFNHAESSRTEDDLLAIKTLREALGVPPF